MRLGGIDDQTWIDCGASRRGPRVARIRHQQPKTQGDHCNQHADEKPGARKTTNTRVRQCDHDLVLS
jgi:hypothetical protein